MVKINSILKIPKPLDKFLNKFQDKFDKRIFLNFKFYIASLFLELKRFSITATISHAINLQYENMQYMISEAKWDVEEINEKRIKILQSNRATKTCKKGVIVIDDTGCKKWGFKTEGVAKQYYPTDGTITKCNIVVSSAYCDNKKRYPVNFRPYKPKEEFFLEEKNPEFRSKIQLAIELIKDILEKKLYFSDFVFDCWYFAKEIVNFLQENFLTFISECDADRKISYHGKWVRADELVKLIPVTKFNRSVTVPNSLGRERSFHLYAFRTKIKNLNGSFLVVIALGSWDSDDSKEVHVYITNHSSLQAAEVVKRYALRWGVEQITRDLKENVYFDHYQVRTIKAINRHWHLAALAYTFLLWSRFNGTFSKIFHQQPQTCGKQLELFQTLNSYTVFNVIEKIKFYQDAIKHHFISSVIS